MINAYRMAACQPGLTLVVGLCACAPAARSSSGSSPAPQSASAEIADSVRRSYTRADVDFMTHMIGHHAQAIVMARMAPTHAASPSIRILAERIINAQQDEIETMQRWLRRRQLPIPEAEPGGMMPPAHEHGLQMPGMLSVDQMGELDAARGVAFDRLFLTYMIHHHQGALTMVDQLFGSHGAAQEETIFKFASDVSADQSTEIARMRSMLATLPETSSAR